MKVNKAPKHKRKYKLEFEIAFKRKINYKSKSFLLPFEMSNTIAFLGRSKKLYKNIMEKKQINQEYTNRKCVHSMVSLLDFSCRFEYDINDNNDNYVHRLNVSLHQYQLQSLRWMIDEENDEIVDDLDL